MSYTNVFGGSSVRPSQPSYEALTISVNTALMWPLETTTSAPYAAAAIDVTATVASLLLMMPPANTGSAGVISMVTNVGGLAFTLTDQGGNAIVSIAPSQSWLIVLRATDTANGSWGAIQMGATTSSASAGSLAGAGLVASGAQLKVNRVSASLNADTLITVSYREQAITWTGGTGTLTLDTIANLTPGWECFINNSGTMAVTFVTSDGSTINGDSSFVMQPGNSGLLVCGASSFETYGAIVTSLAIAAGGTGASSSNGALTNLGGTSIGKSIFTAPNSNSILSILGISNTAAFLEATVSSNQSPNTAAGGTIFVCTAVLQVTLPLTTGLTKHYVLIVSATNGIVTLAPNVADKINGGTAGASVTIASGNSALLTTDANGNWYSVFQGVQTISLTGDATGTGTTSIATTVGAIGGVAITLGGALTTIGAHTLSVTVSADTAITLPTTGTLIAAAGAAIVATTSAGTLSMTVTGNTAITLPTSGTLVAATAGVVTGLSSVGLAGSVGAPTNGMYIPGANNVAFSTAGTQRLRLYPNGDIDVNSSTPNPISSAIVGMGYASATQTLSIYSGTTCMNLGGTFNSETLLNFYYQPASTPTQVGSISISPTTTSFNTTSDRRLKNIEGRISAEESGSIIDRLVATWFNWKSDPESGRQPGFIAQQVNRVFPWSVRRGKGRIGKKNFEPWQMDTAKMVVITVAELQYLRERVAALERRL